MVLFCSCDKADRFYEQALLLVDCCKIPEAIKLLEKVCVYDILTLSLPTVLSSKLRKKLNCIIVTQIVPLESTAQ